MSLLSHFELTLFARQVAPLLGTHCRALPDADRPGAVRIVDDEGRALVLYQDPSKPERLSITALLPKAAETAGITVRPVTVAARCTPGHAAAHIRRRLLPAHAAALAAFTARTTTPADPPASQGTGARGAVTAAPTAVQQRAAKALASLAPPFAEGGGGWVIGERLSRRRPLPAAWWQTDAADGEDKADWPERSMAPFLADTLRRAGLHTTEPRSGRWVFFAPPPPALDGPRHAAEASRRYRAQWDVVDRHTGAKVRSSGDQERAEHFAEQLDTEHEARQELSVASLELPGIQTGAEEERRLRAVAVRLARRGFVPYGLEGVDHADVPGFLVLTCTHRPGLVVVCRVLEPWGGSRPKAGQGAAGAGRRFDRDLAAYAHCLSGPGRRAVVDGEQVRVTFTAAPTLLGEPGAVMAFGGQTDSGDG